MSGTDTDSDESITSPRGSAAMTLILSALSFFAPFYGTLALAIAFACVAIAIIVWLYWQEIINSVSYRAWNSRLIFPCSAIALIALFALFAVFAVVNRSDRPETKPAIELDGVERVVNKAFKTDWQPPSEISQPVPTSNLPEYRIVIQETPITNRPSNGPSSDAMPVAKYDYSQIIERMKRRQTESSVSLECNRKRWGVDAGLVGLLSAAVSAQNQFYTYRVSRQMVGDYNAWIAKADKYVEDNKAELPDTAVYSLASGEIGRSIFVGDGTRAWARMDSKRQALESLRKQLAVIPCDKIGKAAVIEADEKEWAEKSDSADLNRNLSSELFNTTSK